MRVILVLQIVCLSLAIKAQNDSTVFLKQKEVATSDYVFLVPAQWRNIPEVDISSKDKKYEFAGVGLPLEYNHFDVKANLNLRKYECNKIAIAQDYIVTEITSYPDRVTEPGRNYELDSLTILSGEKAMLYSTRFFRRTKISNFTRYDLVVYSKKRKAAYMFTLLFQYHDPTYAFEAQNKLRDYAIKFFGNILLR